jgi:hypothetical protein
LSALIKSAFEGRTPFPSHTYSATLGHALAPLSKALVGRTDAQRVPGHRWRWHGPLDVSLNQRETRLEVPNAECDGHFVGGCPIFSGISAIGNSARCDDRELVWAYESSVPRMRELPAVTDLSSEILQEIGRVIVLHSHLEELMARTVYALVGIDPKRGRIAIRVPGGKEVLATITDLALIAGVKIETDLSRRVVSRTSSSSSATTSAIGTSAPTDRGMMGYRTPNIDASPRRVRSSPTSTPSSPAPPDVLRSSPARVASARACSRSACRPPRRDCPRRTRRSPSC